MNKKCFNLQEAVEIILTPGDDSEFSDLDESEIEDCVEYSDVPERKDDDGDEVGFETEQEEATASTTGGDGQDISDNEGEETDKEDLSRWQNHVYRWRKTIPPHTNLSFKGEQFTLPEHIDEKTPLQYFECFWKADLNNLIAEQSNLYSVQKSGKSVCTDGIEIQKLIGIQMLMSIVKLPRFEMYWVTKTRFPPVADIMSINRNKKLRQCLHCNDNLKHVKEENKNNKLYTIELVLNHVRGNCLTIEPEQNQSIDKQIIPAKTSHSGIRQYNPKKPVKWGFKNFSRSGSSGMIYYFFLCSGSSEKGQKCTGTFCVLKLIESLPHHQNFRLFFGNWFCSLQLCLHLKELGFIVTAALRADRMKSCP